MTVSERSTVPDSQAKTGGKEIAARFALVGAKC
jgi:hypothetical protein